MTDKELKQLNNNFYKLKELINDKFCYKEEIDGFWFTALSIEAVKKARKRHFLNNYYDLTVSDVLTMTDDAKELTDVKKELFYTYQAEYANAWYNNYIEILKAL